MENEPPLRRQVCFALYTASRAVIGLYRPLLDRFGITYPQYLVLLVLWERGDSTVSELGAALQLDSSTLSPLLKRLEATGLVSRRRRVEDERSVLVSLTTAGAELRGPARDIGARVAAVTGVDAAELAALRDTLIRLADSIGRAGPAPTPGAVDTER